MKMGFSFKAILVLICTTILLTLSGCGGSGKDPKAAGTNAKVKKVINIGIMNAPSGFNPLEWSDVAQNSCTAILFQPLVELDDDMKYVPMLADSIETKDNQTFVISLNKKAKWTDGQPVTAADVLFTLKLISNPKVASSVASNFSLLEGLDGNGKNVSGGDITGVKKINDYMLELKTKAPMDLTLFKDAIGTRLKTIPAHVLKDVDPEKLYQHPFMQKPTVSNGPFKLVTYQKGQYVEFEANKEYFKGTPKIDALYMKIMPGANITAQLQSGEIDMNEPNIGLIPFEDTDKVKGMPGIVTDATGVQSVIQTLMINMNTIPDVKVRKAISHAINRKMVIDNLLKGDGEAIEMPYFSSSPFFNKNLPMTAYDPEKAKQLLKEAGWDMSKPINFDVPSGNKVREQVADIITDNLKNVGLNVQVQKYDFVTSLAKAKKGEYDIYIVGIPQYPTNPDVSSTLKTGATLNISKYSNPEMDALLSEGPKVTDPAKRKEIYDKVQELFMRDLPSPSVYVHNNLKAVSKKVKVGKPKSFGMYIDLYQWDVER